METDGIEDTIESRIEGVFRAYSECKATINSVKSAINGISEEKIRFFLNRVKGYSSNADKVERLDKLEKELFLK